MGDLEGKSPPRSYRIYTSLEISEVGLNPPQSPLKSGCAYCSGSPTVKHNLAGDFRIRFPPFSTARTEVQPTCASAVDCRGGSIPVALWRVKLVKLGLD
jgi:hypothetical protein